MYLLLQTNNIISTKTNNYHIFNRLCFIAQKKLKYIIIIILTIINFRRFKYFIEICTIMMTNEISELEDFKKLFDF